MPSYYALRRIDNPKLFVVVTIRGTEHLVLTQTRQEAVDFALDNNLTEWTEPEAVIPAETKFSRYYFGGQIFTREEAIR
ncbi:MAG: hypothetical protein ACRYFS_24445 [Janthinobacterium lividum]